MLLFPRFAFSICDAVCFLERTREPLCFRVCSWPAGHDSSVFETKVHVVSKLFKILAVERRSVVCSHCLRYAKLSKYCIEFGDDCSGLGWCYDFDDWIAAVVVNYDLHVVGVHRRVGRQSPCLPRAMVHWAGWTFAVVQEGRPWWLLDRECIRSIPENQTFSLNNCFV